LTGTNSKGKVTCNFSLSGSDKLEIFDEQYTVNHSADGTKSVEYTIHFGPTITSNLGDGGSAKVTMTLPRLASEPGQVSNLTRAFVAPQRVVLSWSAPSDNGSPIIEYQIQYSTHFSMSDPSTINVGNVLTRAIDGLSLNTIYYFRVRARNDIGWGPYSTSVNQFIPTVPNQVPTPSRVFNAPQTVVLSYSAPNDNGAPITNYEIQYSLSPTFTSSVYSVSAGTALSRSITGLTIGNTWYFRVRAINSQGAGAWSPSTSYVIPNIPGVIAAPTLTYTPPSKVDVVFSAPANGGSSITAYELQYADNSAFATPITVSATAGATKSIIGLIPGRTYFFRARAQNAQGWGPWGTPSNVFIYVGPRVRYLNIYRNTICYVRYEGQWRVAIPYVKYGDVWKIVGG